MTKKHFIALANTIREHNSKAHAKMPFTNSHLDSLADFCKSQNGRFDRSRWLGYIDGDNGPNGGSVRKGRV